MNATAATALTTATLALSGACLWAFGATRLAAGNDFDFTPNPLGVKESPYGQVLALAAQGQVEADWHGVEAGGAPARLCPTCGKVHQTGAACARPGASGSLLGTLEDSVTERTNGTPATDGLKFYLRRQVEDRLRLAYELDPSNYTNYNAYQFFLTEPELGTRRVLNDAVLALAKKTTDYCLREENDPRPSLTAAAAAGNVLLVMFDHREAYTLDMMRAQLALMDQALAKNTQLTDRWVDSGEFQNLSGARQQEMTDHLQFLGKMREAAAATIDRLATSQASL